MEDLLNQDIFLFLLDGLRQYFSQFGDVKDALVMRDPVTKKSR